MCFFRKRRAKKQAAEQQKALEVKKQEDVKAKEDVIVKEAEVKVNEEKTVETKVQEPVKEAETTKDAPVDNKAKKPAKYHVSQNKDSDSPHFKRWRVRKQGSQKTIKYFDTQAEAIAFAEELAESQGSSIVIHKVDGSIRKQDYTKKE